MDFSYALYEGRVVQVISQLRSPDGSESAGTMIQDGQSRLIVVDNKLKPYSLQLQPETAPAPTSLVFVNQVSDAVPLTDLPTVGKTSAQRILERRPETGYTSLEHMAEVNKDLRYVDWNAVAPLLRFDVAG